MKPFIEDAISLATHAHCGQTDKAGLPYILHPLRVMSRFVAPEDYDERMVAVLHDVVEDTAISLDMLRAAGYPAAVIEAVDAISRRVKESYAAYIERVAKCPLARRVKLADLEDNLDPARASTGMLSDTTYSQYRAAQAYLERGDVAS